VVLGTLLGEESKISTTVSFELTVRHDGSVEGIGLGLVSDDDFKRVFLHKNASGGQNKNQ